MAILVRKSGMMIGGKVLKETDAMITFQAMDNKHPTKVKVSCPKQRVFDGKDALKLAEDWLKTVKKESK